MEYHGLLNSRVLTAMRKRDVEKVQKLLLMPNFDLNYTSQKKITPLILAAKLGLFSVCDKLVSLKVDLSCSDLDGRTALHHACYHGYTDIVNLLIAAGCKVNAVNLEGDLSLHEAVSNGNVQTVAALLAAGSDINRPNQVTGSTPLDLSVLHERADIVNTLLQGGADIHRKSSAGETALHFAVQVGSLKIIEELLGAGANINCVNNLGETPLALAVQEKKLNIVKYLVEAGCKLDHSEYLSPLYIACRQNSQDIICYFLSEGFDLSKYKWIMRYTYLRLEESSPELLAYVFHRCENPLTLKEICRSNIRKALQPRLKDKIIRLKLPKSVAQWVTSDIIYDF